jgi:hypothetical protein
MKDLQPAVFKWLSGPAVMMPSPASLPLCLRQFVGGEEYRLSAEEERSVASHRQFMAVVNEAFDQLPERYAGRFKSADHLRYWCLISCGFASEKTVLLDTEQDAQRVADYIAQEHQNTHVQVRGNVVTIWTAKSQKYESMNKKEFEATHHAVFDLLSDMIGTSVTELKKNAGRAA